MHKRKTKFGLKMKVRTLELLEFQKPFGNRCVKAGCIF